MSAAPSSAALIGIDWGSSNLRVALIGARGELLERRESQAGVFAVKDGDFTGALWPLCADWVARHGVALLACGMVGSRQGIVEVPYLPCPAALGDLASGLGRTVLAGTAAALHIVPGLKRGSDLAGWDVVRGEETQLLGIDAAPGSLCVLPGTHSKWMVLDPVGRIESFQTYMTGELFELLSQHGSLSRMMTAPKASAEAFAQGLREARDQAIEGLLFRVRTAGLIGRFESSALADYLSGMLIGAELKAGLAQFAHRRAGEPITLVGGERLTQRYAAALAAFGVSVKQAPADAVFQGLLAIALQAGLVKKEAML